MDYDTTNQAANYDAGRGYAPDVLAHWLGLIASWVPDRPEIKILDLGCGTGRYSVALAEHFNADVIAVDPSETMLAQARKKTAHRVRYERASGESLPLSDESIDVIFMSMVFHHFVHPARVLQECYRVLGRGGTVCLRGGSYDQVDTYPTSAFFPQSRILMQEKLPLRETMRSLFHQEGFNFLHHELVHSEVAANWDAYAKKLAYRADSLLVPLSDREFDDGMALLREHAATRPTDEPIIEFIDFFVFGRS